MWFLRSGSVVLAFLMMFVPSAAAQVEGSATMDFRTPSELYMVLDGKVSGEEAADMRQMMDTPSDYTQGDGDGQVEQNEVDAIETFFKGIFGEMEDSEATPTGSFTVDGKAPSSFSLVTVDIRDATGSVDSTDALTIHLEFKSMFDVTAGDRHTVRIEADESNESEDDDSSEFGDIGTISLKAPKGYIIDSTTGLPAGGSVSGDKKSISFTEVPKPTGEDIVIVFAKGGGSSPGPALWASLGLLGAVVVLRRRRA